MSIHKHNNGVDYSDIINNAKNKKEETKEADRKYKIAKKQYKALPTTPPKVE
ncbi:MAG: hypothetical protein LBV62_01940 [Rickettsiales bacterium]|jgi:hypothetical protein|nr:hypothetical protein [Rickettsiales bacterium]